VSKETTINLKLQTAPNPLELSPLTQAQFHHLKPRTETAKSRFQWVTSEGRLETKDKKLICENEVNTKFIN